MDDFRQLRQVLALAEFGHFGRAADHLGITKSALSQTISRIEDIFGVELFTRARKGVKPTIYGSILIEDARRGLAIFDQTYREFQLLKNMQAGRLIIGGDPATTEVLLGPALLEIVSTYPKLLFTVKSGFWADCKEQLESRELDIYVGIKPDEEIHGFDVIEFDLPQIVVYCRSGHPLAASAAFDFSEYYKYPLLGAVMPDWFLQRISNTLPPGALTSEQLRSFFLVTNDEGTMRAIVKQSDALSGTFYALIKEDVEGGKLAVLPVANEAFNAKIPCVIVTNETRLLPPSAKLLSSIVLKAAARLPVYGT